MATALLVALFFTTSPVLAQGVFSIHGGLSLPASDFADDDWLNDEEAGGAGIGFGAGLQYNYPISDAGLDIYGGLDVIINGLSGDVVDDIEDGGADVESNSLYINIPISAGLQYTIPSNGSANFFIKAGVVGSVMRQTDLELEDNAGNNAAIEYSPNTTIGISAGAGVILNENVTIAVTYFSMGEKDIDVEFDNGQESDFEMPVTLATLTVGYRFLQ